MSNYTAWLIEMDEGGPVYFQMVDDDDWTKDHDKAMHFGRKQDAERIIAYYGWTRAKAAEHMWAEPGRGIGNYEKRLHDLLQGAATRINAAR